MIGVPLGHDEAFNSDAETSFFKGFFNGIFRSTIRDGEFQFALHYAHVRIRKNKTRLYALEIGILRHHALTFRDLNRRFIGTKIGHNNHGRSRGKNQFWWESVLRHPNRCDRQCTQRRQKHQRLFHKSTSILIVYTTHNPTKSKMLIISPIAYKKR